MPFSMPIGADNRLMQIKRNYIGPLMSVEQARRELTREAWLEKEEEEHISVAQIRARGKKGEPVESIVPTVVSTEGEGCPTGKP